MSMTHRPGTQIDHYEIVRMLGHGGMSRVYLARDVTNQQEVVLKFPNDDLIGNVAVFERYQRKAEIENRNDQCVNVDGGMFLGGPGFVYQLPA